MLASTHKNVKPLQQKTQRRLCWRLSLRLRDFDEDFVFEHYRVRVQPLRRRPRRAADRHVAGDVDVFRIAVLDQLFLLEQQVTLDLVHGRHHGGVLQQAVQAARAVV